MTSEFEWEPLEQCVAALMRFCFQSKDNCNNYYSGTLLCNECPSLLLADTWVISNDQSLHNEQGHF